jgi:hypothetical protein
MPTPDLLAATEVRGLALPATKGPGGYFESKTPQDVAWGNLLLALLTPQGGRFMRRGLGSALYEQLFEPVVEGDFPLVDYTIREAAARQLATVNITRTDISVRNSGRGLDVHVFFRLRSDLEVEESRTVQIPKTIRSGAV